MELKKALNSQNTPPYEVYDPNEFICLLITGPNEPKGDKIEDKDPVIIKYHILYIPVKLWYSFLKYLSLSIQHSGFIIIKPAVEM